MEYFVYCRDKRGTEQLIEEFAEAHWAFMDAYGDAMIARGPTLTTDRTTHTGSMHMVELPDGEAARVFAFEEPYYKAGVYDDVLVRRWGNELGRTMWEFPARASGDPRFLIIGHGRPAASAAAGAVLGEHRRYLDYGYGDRLIAYGPLLSDNGAEWVGLAMLVQLPDREAVDSMLADEPYRQAALYANVEIHDWEFGGRPAA